MSKNIQRDQNNAKNNSLMVPEWRSDVAIFKCQLGKKGVRTIIAVVAAHFVNPRPQQLAHTLTLFKREKKQYGQVSPCATATATCQK